VPKARDDDEPESPIRVRESAASPRRAASEDEPPTDTVANKSLGRQHLNDVAVRLIFDEPNPIKMTIETELRFTATDATRLIERQSLWTGSGVVSRPRIEASAGEQRLRPRVQGPPWDEGRRRYYLVDLGETVPEMSNVWLKTSQTFLDERQRFKPYLLHQSPAAYDSLTLSVSFVSEVKSCQHLEKPAGSAKWSDPELVEPELSNSGAFVFTKSYSKPMSGLYMIAWGW
jgi:hypothetical protein